MESNLTQLLSFLDSQTASKKDSTSFYLTEERMELIGRRLEEFMRNGKPFLKSRYCMKDLSNDLQLQLAGFTVVRI